MRLLRFLMVTLCAAAGLVVFTQVPASACSCVAADTAEYVEWADVVFVGTLTEIEETNPGDDDVVSSADPVRYTFDVEETSKGEAGAAVVESALFGASCGLEGMEIDLSYVVFATVNKQGGLDANLCTGTSVATEKLVGEVEAALAPAPTASEVPQPLQPVPTQVPSGVEQASPADGARAWAWWGGGGVLLAIAGAGALLRPRMR